MVIAIGGIFLPSSSVCPEKYTLQSLPPGMYILFIEQAIDTNTNPNVEKMNK
jgi:hypothetical protein